MSSEGAPGRLAHGGEEIFFQTLCDQVDGVYRTYRQGQLNLNRGIQHALEHVGGLLLDVQPEHVGALTALRARIAHAQTSELLAVLEQFNGGIAAGPLRALCPSAPITERPALQPVPEPFVPAATRTPRRGRKVPRFWWAVAAAGLALIGYAVYGGSGGGTSSSPASAASHANALPASSARSRPLTGQVVIVAYSQKERLAYSSTSAPGRPCQGAGGYSDMRPGQSVFVANASGSRLAVGRLGAGSAMSVRAGSGREAACAFSINVPDVPNSPTYQLSFGSRGPVVYSYQQLAASGWSPSITLGP